MFLSFQKQDAEVARIFFCSKCQVWKNYLRMTENGILCAQSQNPEMPISSAKNPLNYLLGARGQKPIRPLFGFKAVGGHQGADESLFPPTWSPGTVPLQSAPSCLLAVHEIRTEQPDPSSRCNSLHHSPNLRTEPLSPGDGPRGNFMGLDKKDKLEE